MQNPYANYACMNSFHNFGNMDKKRMDNKNLKEHITDLILWHIKSTLQIPQIHQQLNKHLDCHASS